MKHFLWSTVLSLFAATIALGAPDADLLPKAQKDETIIHHLGYSLSYNETHEQANWVAYKLTGAEVKGQIKRDDDFRPDPDIAGGSAELEDYKHSGYDRGHLAPAADMKWSRQAMSESFLMSNMSPQLHGFNDGAWGELEEFARQMAMANEEIYITAGPIFKDISKTIGPNKVSVPGQFYKVIVDYKTPDVKGIGFIMPHKEFPGPLDAYAVSIDEVEAATGLDFFADLPDAEENILEAQKDFTSWIQDAKKRGFNPSKLWLSPADNRKDAVEQPVVLSNQARADSAAIPAGTLFYVTKSGAKFHRKTCAKIEGKTTTAITFEEVQKFYKPCTFCRPY